MQWVLLPRWVQKLIICSSLLILVGSISLFWKSGSPKQTIHAEEAYQEWKKNPASEQAKNFKEAIRKAPKLRHILRGELAQLLLMEGNVDEAEKISRSALENLQSLSSDHAEFSRITFLIQRGKYEEALERSRALRDRISNQHSVLYARNLLRIGFLSDWNEWKEFAQRQPALARAALKGFEGRVRFQTYIDEVGLNF